jgi:hypothetical protein
MSGKPVKSSSKPVKRIAISEILDGGREADTHQVAVRIF